MMCPPAQELEHLRGMLTIAGFSQDPALAFDQRIGA